MLSLRVQVLGTTAARPFPGRFTSSVYLARGGSSILIDCGEGILTQLPPKALGQRGLDAVCITHLHGDHVFGLPGLLASMTLGGRTRRLSLLGPPALRGFVEAALGFTSSSTSFELAYPVLPEGASATPVLALCDLIILSLPLRHRVVAFGFCVSSPPQQRRIRPGVVERYDIPYGQIASLKMGADLQLGNTAVPNADLTLDPHPRQTFAYLTDTAPLDAWPEGWPRADAMLHDATFGPDDVDLARVSGHSTTLEAAAFAKTSLTKTLLLSHASVRYSATDLQRFADAADLALRDGDAGERPRARWAIEGEVIEL